jgi:hypothetical protein
MKKAKKEIVEGDATHLIERLEAFEERVGVRLEALFAYIRPDIDWLQVNGELHPREGATLKENIAVHVAAYDSSGRLVAKSQATLLADEFFRFEALETSAQLPIRGLSKIRVYPKVA